MLVHILGSLPLLGWLDLSAAAQAPGDQGESCHSSQRISLELAYHRTCQCILAKPHAQSTGQLTCQGRSVKAFVVILNPTKPPKPELHRGSHNLLTTECWEFKNSDEKNSSGYLTLGEKERKFPQQQVLLAPIT